MLLLKNHTNRCRVSLILTDRMEQAEGSRDKAEIRHFNHFR